MRGLELLAPARNMEIGIAAIDCGADAVYIAGPQFGARQAAGNEIDDIRQLCVYAHKFGARIFVTLNTILYDDELEAAYRQMLQVQEAGADAIIVQDLAVLEMARNGYGGLYEKLNIPLHASTQCAIRTPEQAVFYEKLGFSRLILEREISIEQIKAIRKAVSCELEFFVHGALCVCYSGHCYLSEKIAGRSANRGACIQACRSRYDLVDADGKVLVRNKALLSLKDYNLRNRLKELADAGISSFKIEGRLKNISYVKNVVRDYSLAIDEITADANYIRESFGRIHGGFRPDTRKTFNRGYTELFIDGKRDEWASMDSAKGMGEYIGEVSSINKDRTSFTIAPASSGTDMKLNNSDGFSFVARNSEVVGFRGDVCSGWSVRCKQIPELYPGAKIFRNVDSAFEKEIERNVCSRLIDTNVIISFTKDPQGNWQLTAVASTEDGREAKLTVPAGTENAGNIGRMEEIIHNQISKQSSHYRFCLNGIRKFENELPFMAASTINAVRRSLAEELDRQPCRGRKLHMATLPDSFSSILPPGGITYRNNVSNHLSTKVYIQSGATEVSDAYELGHHKDAELMRTRYCIKHELGICPIHHKSGNTGPLYLINNGQRFILNFECKSCEMTVKEA